MNGGEKNAVEAMLDLCRPGYTNLTSISTTANNPSRSDSMTPSAGTLPDQVGSPSGTALLSRASELTSGSSVSPSQSPARSRRSGLVSGMSDMHRPKAMRLSQLLTEDSQPDAPVVLSPLVQQPQGPRLPQSLQLPTGTRMPHSSATPLTEPLTPPFSPPVLPPLSTVAGVTLRPEMVDVKDRGMGAAGGWLRAQQNSPGNTAPHLNRQVNRTAVQIPSKFGLQGATTRSTNEVVKKIMKRPYKKYYSNPTPSSHCHVCARTSKAVKFAVCARIAEGLCRKVTCYKCFAKFGWDWESAVNSKTWICVHCRGECPEGRSQCYIYSRVNSKRESKRKKAAQAKAKAAALEQMGGGVSQNNSPSGRYTMGGKMSVPPLPSLASLAGKGITSLSDQNRMGGPFVRLV